MVELIDRELSLFKNPVKLNISLLTRSRQSTTPPHQVDFYDGQMLNARHYVFHPNRVMIFMVSNGFVDCSRIFQEMSLCFKEQEPSLKALCLID